MKFIKDFKRWHDKKSAINEIDKCPFFHEREIWFCHLGVNVGFEQDGTGNDFLRPVIIVRKFSSEIFWAVPLSKFKADKKIKKQAKDYYFEFSFTSGIKSVAVLSQIRLIDGKRLSYLVGEISENDFKELKKKLKALLP